MQWVVRSATWGCYSGGLRRESESFSELHILSSLCSFAPHSPTHSLICSLVLSLLIYSLIFSLTYPPTHTHSLTDLLLTCSSLACSLIYSSLSHLFICSLAHFLLSHSFSHLLTLTCSFSPHSPICSLSLACHLLTHSLLSHSPTHSLIYDPLVPRLLALSLTQAIKQPIHAWFSEAINISINYQKPTNQSIHNQIINSLINQSINQSGQVYASAEHN